MNTPSPHFFMSYSRENAEVQRRIAAELPGRGIHVWVDVENLIPGSPTWEREIERSIRAASGVIVLLSPTRETWKIMGLASSHGSESGIGFPSRM